jgi:hypothetical protein
VQDGIRGQKFSHRKARLPQQVPRRASAVVIANDLDSHDFPEKSKEVATRLCLV